METFNEYAKSISTKDLMDEVARAFFIEVTLDGFYVVFVVVFILLNVILIIRYIELTFMYVISPLFFASLVADVTNDIFKNYIKYFIVVAFQIIVMAVFLIILNLAAYGSLMPFELDHSSGGAIAGSVKEVFSEGKSDAILSLLNGLVNMTFGEIQILIIGFFVIKSKLIGAR